MISQTILNNIGRQLFETGPTIYPNMNKKQKCFCKGTTVEIAELISMLIIETCTNERYDIKEMLSYINHFCKTTSYSNKKY